jgi:hypothetical protein
MLAPSFAASECAPSPASADASSGSGGNRSSMLHPASNTTDDNRTGSARRQFNSILTI